MWDYRIVHRIFGDEHQYSIHEAYYNDDGSIYAISADPCVPLGESKKELINDHARMQGAIIKSVLEYDMKFAPCNKSKPSKKVAMSTTVGKGGEVEPIIGPKAKWHWVISAKAPSYGYMVVDVLLTEEDIRNLFPGRAWYDKINHTLDCDGLKYMSLGEDK